jgi:transposase
MFFIGVDLSDRFFDCCITNSFRDVVSRNRFDFNDDGFYSFIQHIREKELNSQNCIIGLENPRSRLVDFLVTRGYTILPVNPGAIARYRESRSPSKAKSDQGDAQLIADYIREHRKALRAVKIPDEEVRELKLLLEDRDRLVKEKVRLSNQLTNTLKDYFPQALDAFGDITSRSALEFLKRFDTFVQAKSLSCEDIEQFLDQCRCYHKKARDRFRNTMKRRPSQIPQEIVRTKARLKNILVGHLAALIQEIKDYEKQIQQVMGEIPHGDIFRSLPGADYILGAKLLVLYDGKEFSSATEAGAFYGTAPYTARSGRSVHIRFRRGCNKFGRGTFHQLARCSLKKSKWAKKQFANKREEGKGYHHALRCVSNLWVKVTFAMWRDKIPYDEGKHLASIASHLIDQPSSFSSNC